MHAWQMLYWRMVRTVEWYGHTQLSEPFASTAFAKRAFRMDLEVITTDLKVNSIEPEVQTLRSRRRPA